MARGGISRDAKPRPCHLSAETLLGRKATERVGFFLFMSHLVIWALKGTVFVDDKI